jgi:hypothetical protein
VRGPIEHANKFPVQKSKLRTLTVGIRDLDLLEAHTTCRNFPKKMTKKKVVYSYAKNQPHHGVTCARHRWLQYLMIRKHAHKYLLNTRLL